MASVLESPVVWAARILAAAGVESPRLEAQLLLALALDVSRTAVVAELYTPLTEAQAREFQRLVQERAKRVPLAYLRGTQEFYGLSFRVTPAVLIPRPETELLVEFAREKMCDTALLFDVGTGSGCILTAALAHCLAARGVGIDLSSEALQVACCNARSNGIAERARFVLGDLLSGGGAGCCDVIVSNPPYIPSSDLPALQPEVRYWEPDLALDGGLDGLVLHRRLAEQASRALRPGGWLGVEVALGQASVVAEILTANRFYNVATRRDLAHIERIVVGQKPDLGKKRGMDKIVCQQLTKTFGALTAVDRMTLQVGEGELFGFLGPNGAGKTTTIKMLTGLLYPTSGSASIGGWDIQRQPLEARRILGYIPDNPFLYEKLTGREFLSFMADLYSVALTDRSRRMDDLLGLFELQDKGNELIQSYSRGMRQKIALAGALIHTPEVIFLDEPTVGLDPKGSRTMRDILRELCRRGTTVFMSTHILEVAERMCDRIVIVNKGRVIAQGTMEELRAARSAAVIERDGAENAAAADPMDAKRSLEDIFLELTGEAEHADLIQYLG